MAVEWKEMKKTAKKKVFEDDDEKTEDKDF